MQSDATEGPQDEFDRKSTSDQRVLASLRRMILDGSIKSGEKITEVGVASLLAVSRTPARLALRTLEVEGFIRKRAGRGFTVVGVQHDDVSKAYEVRGVLEGLAARSMAQNRPHPETDAKLRKALEMTGEITAARTHCEDSVSCYQDGNTLFHETIMNECGNSYLPFTYARLQSVPLLKLGVLVFNRNDVEQELLRLTVGHTQHMIIYDAISRGDAARAEAMMREHSNATVLYSEVFA